MPRIAGVNIPEKKPIEKVSVNIKKFVREFLKCAKLNKGRFKLQNLKY